jgi:ribonuclease HI
MGELPRIELYTDGACSGNPGPGGWAFILRDVRSGTEREESGGEARTTNNRMELISVIRGLRALTEACMVSLYSDSQYVINGLNDWLDQWKAAGWTRKGRKPVKNIELWKELDELRDFHRLDCHWVRGHSDHPENERCDRLAVAALEHYRE